MAIQTTKKTALRKTNAKLTGPKCPGLVVVVVVLLLQVLLTGNHNNNNNRAVVVVVAIIIAQTTMNRRRNDCAPCWSDNSNSIRIHSILLWEKPRPICKRSWITSTFTTMRRRRRKTNSRPRHPPQQQQQLPPSSNIQLAAPPTTTPAIAPAWNWPGASGTTAWTTTNATSINPPRAADTPVYPATDADTAPVAFAAARSTLSSWRMVLRRRRKQQRCFCRAPCAMRPVWKPVARVRARAGLPTGRLWECKSELWRGPARSELQAIPS